jgi:hypothetical protein
MLSCLLFQLLQVVKRVQDFVVHFHNLHLSVCGIVSVTVFCDFDMTCILLFNSNPTELNATE